MLQVCVLGGNKIIFGTGTKLLVNDSKSSSVGSVLAPEHHQFV